MINIFGGRVVDQLGEGLNPDSVKSGMVHKTQLDDCFTILRILIKGEEVERVSCLKSGGPIMGGISNGEQTTAIVKKAHHWLYFLWTIKKNNLPTELLKAFYHCFVEIVLIYCITAWYVNCTENDKKSLKRVNW